jgi:TusA-related sulfurtransferase
MISESEITLDLRGKQCPYTLMELSQAVRRLTPGGVLEVLLDGPDGVEEVKAWCEATGRGFVGPNAAGPARVYVRRGGHG